MSTKVYDAYRVTTPSNSRQAWEVVRSIQKQATLNVRAKLKKAYLRLVNEVDTTSKEYQEAHIRHDSEVMNKVYFVRDTIRKEYQKAQISQARSYFDLDVCIAIHPHKSRLYLRAFCDPGSLVGGSLDFLNKFPGVQDFHYQNQVDPPTKVPPRAWKHRQKVWDEIMDAETPLQVVLEVCTSGRFFMIDPVNEVIHQLSKKSKNASKTTRS